MSKTLKINILNSNQRDYMAAIVYYYRLFWYSLRMNWLSDMDVLRFLIDKGLVVAIVLLVNSGKTGWQVLRDL